MSAWLLHFPWVLPTCAAAAGLLTWLWTRKQEHDPEVNELLMDFGALMGLALLCSYGLFSLR